MASDFAIVSTAYRRCWEDNDRLKSENARLREALEKLIGDIARTVDFGLPGGEIHFSDPNTNAKP